MDKEVTKLSLFADDIVCYIQEPVQSITKLCELIESFGSIARFKVNRSKSELLGFNIGLPSRGISLLNGPRQ